MGNKCCHKLDKAKKDFEDLLDKSSDSDDIKDELDFGDIKEGGITLKKTPSVTAQ